MQNKDFQITPNKYLKTLTILHLTLVLGLVILGTVFYFTTKNWRFDYSESDNVFFYIVPIFSAAGFFIGDFVYKLHLKKLKSNPSLKGKLLGYQTAAVIKYASLEGPAMFAIVVANISANLFFILIAFLLTAYMYSLKPTKLKIKEALELNSEHEAQFRDGDQLID